MKSRCEYHRMQSTHINPGCVTETYIVIQALTATALIDPG